MAHDGDPQPAPLALFLGFEGSLSKLLNDQGWSEWLRVYLDKQGVFAGSPVRVAATGAVFAVAASKLPAASAVAAATAVAVPAVGIGDLV